MTTNCIGLQEMLDLQIVMVENGVQPETFAHCVACGSTRIEGTDYGQDVYCLDCKATESTVEWLPSAELPAELARIWADAPVIPPAYIITTEVYQMADTLQEAA